MELKESIIEFILALQESGIPVLEDEEIANIIYEDLSEIVESAKLVGVMEVGAGSATFSGLGVIAGLISSGRATKANIRIVDNLVKAKANCQDDECKEKIDKQIERYKMKIGDRNWSMIRRSIGGGLTTPIGSLVYHYYDKGKKIKGINKTSAAIVNKSLEKCKNLPYKERVKCEQEIKDKYSKFISKTKGKYVYRNDND